VKSLVSETVILATVGILLALGANALSPRGLKLTRNYAPGSALSASHSFSSPSSGTSVATAPTDLEGKFRAEGLQLADNAKAIGLFQDPRREQGLILFVDARDDEHYHAGHIPGAFQLDHYHPEGYLAAVLPASQAAEQIVVYCKGGSCEDSEQTAIFLRDAGVPKDRLFVYAGGFDEWTAHHLPIETGERNSGQIRDEKVTGQPTAK
jgi:rhodanese-related sulfurtransferase